MDYKEYFNQNLNNLLELLKINSIYDETSVSLDAPYGKGVKDALLFMKQLADKDGFNTVNYDNEVLTINYVNKADSRFDIASHLDVVSVDNSWTINPFDPQIIDDKLYGRGTADMKTAAFLTYLALKLLKENYPETKNEIRLVFGSDEERTMDDMRHYVAKVNKPLFAFSPDGTFPMCIGEKGALMWTIKGNYKGIIETLVGGIQCNVVSPICKVTLINNEYTEKINEYIIKNNINGNIEEINNKTTFTIKGVAMHASRNFLGVNATDIALQIIKDVCHDDLAVNLNEVFENDFGEGLGIKKISDDNFLTVNLGVLKIENEKVFGQVDARYPKGMTSLELTQRVKERCILDVSLDYDDGPSGCELDDPYVKVLLDTYQEITHDETKPFVSGGVSYSKVFNHSVTFGPGRLDKENLAHQKDEYIEIADAILALEIYYKTFVKLAFM